MRAAVFAGPGRPLRVEHRPVPRAEPGEVVLRVAFCGICGRLVARISGVDVLSPIRFRGHAMRTYSGRPRLSMRFSTGTAEA
jgi:D-arabinose 1-dehydrogenase-like Zn-dependent alcohol dehydrogenase